MSKRLRKLHLSDGIESPLNTALATVSRLFLKVMSIGKYSTQKTEMKNTIKRQVLIYYIIVWDSIYGLVSFRICTWVPCMTYVYFNGYEALKCHFEQNGIDYSAYKNSIVDLDKETKKAVKKQINKMLQLSKLPNVARKWFHFHSENVTGGGGSDCISCHSPSDVNISKFARHANLNISDGGQDNVTNSDCWTCHYQKDMDRNHVYLCERCHSNSSGIVVVGPAFIEADFMHGITSCKTCHAPKGYHGKGTVGPLGIVENILKKKT